MVSSLGPTLADAYTCIRILVHFDKSWLQNCPSLSLITTNSTLMISLFF